MKEIWKNIENYEGLYQVSNLGRVRRLAGTITEKNTGTIRPIHGRVLKASIDSGGYEMISLWRNNKGKWVRVHQLVARAFIDNPEGKRTINHINGDKTVNKVSNLEWATHSENNQHAHNKGLMNVARGEDSPKSKLSNADVKTIRGFMAMGLKNIDIANAYGIDDSQISRIRSGKVWQTVQLH